MEGDDTKPTGYVVMMAAILVVLLVAGCTNTPEKEASNASNQNEVVKVPITNAENQGQDRYVQINFLDGTSLGGKYVSETAAFTTIEWLYTLDPSAYTTVYSTNGNYSEFSKDPDKYIVRGDGRTVGFKNALINTMIDISDPKLVIEAAEQELRDEHAAIDKKAEEYRIAKEKREAKQTQG